jgi:DNA (cytosine-5)-methyltransferase 1
VIRRIVDLFCGAGGASVGYSKAFPDAEIVGVDVVRQHDYPFEFILADAMTFDVSGFDLIHASPPCKLWTVARKVAAAKTDVLFDPHPDLLTPTLARLRELSTPWVVENVPGAPLSPAVVLCGSMFGLRVRRHRLFATSFVVDPPRCRHDLQSDVVGVYGLGGAWTRTAPGGGGRKVVGADAADALGITHTTRQSGLSQAIPPAYTEFLGRQLAARLDS